MIKALHNAALAQIEVYRHVRAGQPPTEPNSAEYRSFVAAFGPDLPEDVCEGLEEVGVR